METQTMGMQLVLPMLTRIDGPKMVRPEEIAHLQSFREVVRWAWSHRNRRHLTQRLLAEELGTYASHVSDYLNEDDLRKRRSLPAERVALFDVAMGHKAASQWLAMRAELPVVVMQERLAA